MKKPVGTIVQTATHKGLKIDPSREIARLEVPEEYKNSSLVVWCAKYLESEVRGIQSPNTFDAKVRDMKAFMSFFLDLNGHLSIEQWTPRDTVAFMRQIESLGHAPASINRAFCTLRRFARWASEQPNAPFQSGLPTRQVHELAIEEPPAQKLELRDVYALFKASDNLVLTEQAEYSRPRRNRAILALLFYTGIRVSELVNLKIDQYDGKHLQNVKRKGRVRSKVYVPKDCRGYLDEYIDKERGKDAVSTQYLFLPKQGAGPLTRYQVCKVLNHIADEANKHRKELIHIHPHRLRHTFGFEVRKKTGSDTETAALLGHSGLKYVGRYVRQTDEEREKVLETIGI